jgi:hypothetical protein
VPVTIGGMPDEPGATAHTFRAELRALIGDPAIPLPAIGRWLDELGRQGQQRGSLRPVLMLRTALALDIGDYLAASAHLAAALGAPPDPTGDCPACESGDAGRWRAAQGDDGGALEQWAPVLDGTLRCADEPGQVLARALLPLARAGRLDDARGAHLRGYLLVRGHRFGQAAVGRHIEFCALTGNEARGLAILTEHAAWLAEPDADAPGYGNALSWLEFATGACVLLRRLVLLGHGGLPVGDGTVAGRLALLEGEIPFLCDRYGVRNGNAVLREQVTARLAQEPLTGTLPLGAPARLPALPPADQAAAAPETSLDDLIGRARQLRDDRHPHARQAWEQVAASGQDLPADVAAELARQRAGALAEQDPRAGHQALLAAAAQLAAAGDEARACEARAAAALAQAQAGDADRGRSALDAALADADEAFARAAFTPRQYLIVRRSRALLAFQAAAAGPADSVEAVEAIAAELAEAERLGVPRYAANYRDLLAQLAIRRGDPGQARTHLAQARRLYLDAGEPWYAARAEGRAAQVALTTGDPKAAEDLVRDALSHGGDTLAPAQAAGLQALLADALGAQPGREPEAVDAALTAAAQWDALRGGRSPRDAVHLVFQAARAYGRAGRHGEAVSLFAEVMPYVEVPYEVPEVAVTHDQYGQSLRAVGRAQDAAGQFQRAAELYASLGEMVPRVRCLRAAAWLEASVDSMRAVLAELTQLAALAPDEETELLAAELTATRTELDQLRTEPGLAVEGRVTVP